MSSKESEGPCDLKFENEIESARTVDKLRVRFLL